jgi:hypothetical protein
LKNETLAQFRDFCREMSSRILRDLSLQEDILITESSTPLETLKYCCEIKGTGSSIESHFLVFFSEDMAKNLVKEALPWEKNPSLKVALSIFEEYANMMMASLQKSMSRVDFLNLTVPRVKILQDNTIPTQESAPKTSMINDSWFLKFKFGTLYNQLKTQIKDPDNFDEGNFDCDSEFNLGGQAIIF